MMKKILFPAFIVLNSFAFSQYTGKVGINTPSPQRTLDLEGDLRVKIVNDKSADASYTNVLIQNPTTGFVDAIPKTSLSTEPWRVQGTSTQATLNTQNIYQQGNIAIGKPSASGVNLLHIFGSNVNSGINSTNYAKGIIITDAGNPGGYIENTLALSSQKVMKQWMELATTNDNTYNWQSVSDDAQSVIKHLMRLNINTGNMGIGPAFQPNNISGLPTQRLDIDGNARIRSLVDASSDNSYTASVVAKADGTLGYIKRYYLDDIYEYSDNLTQQVTTSVGGSNSVDLPGYSKTITIPANKNAKIIISYGIPAYLEDGHIGEGYVGIRLFKNGSELISGSKMETIIPSYKDAPFQVGTRASVSLNVISASTTDTILSSPSPQTITYKLQGFSLYNTVSPYGVYFGVMGISKPNWVIQVFLKDN